MYDEDTAYILQSCGCTVKVDYWWYLQHPVKTDWMRTVPCKKCWAKARLKKAQKIKKQFALPDLDGSDKQIQWAESIRADFFVTIHGCLYGCTGLKKIAKHFDREMKSFTPQQLFIAIDQLRQTRSAHYWIQRRKMRLADIFQEILKNQSEDQYLLEHSSLADEAREEATISPKRKLVRNTPVEIELFGDEVRAWFPYRDKKFWNIIRRVLEFNWTGECWEKTTEMTNSTAIDLAAEAGHRLLSAGYKVMFWDDEIRAKAINGNYTPGRTRWIFVDDKGNFAVKFNYHDDLYKEARKIAGSRYEKPYVRVIPSEFPELLDFAELFDFNFTNEALELVEEQKRIAAEVTLTDVAPVSSRKKKKGRRKLNPDEVTGEIHEDLRDD